MQEHYLLPQIPFADLDDYHHAKGNALKKARKMTSLEIIDELKASRLRGRGGAGFPTGKKWQTLFEDDAEIKFVVVNAAEGEPGTFKDRMVMRKNPYAVIEGALIAAHVLGTKNVYIAIKGTFYKELERIHSAINEFRAKDLLEDINIYLVAGPEDYLYGEEKALLNVIEGIGPLPREAHYPPYVLGLFSGPNSPNPALVNNVETYARVPEILLRGAGSFLDIGTEASPGPFICTVSGDVKHEGVFEVPGGTTLRELLDHYAGGPRGKFDYKLVLNGVSARVITKENLSVSLDYEEMAKIGSWLGSCSFIVYDDYRSVPRIAHEVARFLYNESCNQCPPCKGGLGISFSCIDALFSVEKDDRLISGAIHGAEGAPQGNRCYLPVQGSIVIPSLIENFRHEFQELLESRGPWPIPVSLPLLADYREDRKKFIHAGQETLLPSQVPPWPADENYLDRQSYSR